MQEIGPSTKMSTLVANSDQPMVNQHIALSWDCSKVAVYSFDRLLRVFSVDKNRITNVFRWDDKGDVTTIRWSKCGKYLGALSLKQLTVFNIQDNTYDSIEEDIDTFEFLECECGWGIVGYSSSLSSKLNAMNATVISNEENPENQDKGSFIVYYSEDKYRKEAKSKDYIFDQLIRFEDGFIGAVNWDDLKCTFINFWEENNSPVSIELPPEMAEYKDCLRTQAYYNQPTVAYINDDAIELIDSNLDTQRIEGIQYGLNILNCDFTGCKFDNIMPDDEVVQKIIINGGKYNIETD